MERNVLFSIIELLRHMNVDFIKLKTQVLGEVKRNMKNERMKEIFGNVRGIEVQIQRYLELLV